MIKKILFIFIIFSLFISCKKVNKLYIYNWSYYIPNEIITSFEKEFNCKVVYDVFSSNEEMYAKLKAGGSGYDIVFPSGDFVSIMINEGLLEKIDKSKIVNFKNIDTNILRKIKFDEGNVYSVPYIMGAVGIAINTKFVSINKKDYSIYNNFTYKNKMTLLDDMREVIGAALSYNGYSVNSVNMNELEKAKETVLFWKKNILKFDSESFAKGFSNEEFWVVQCYAENVFLELSDNQKKNTEFFIPKKGGTMYIDSMVILKNSKNKELAYKFINYIHRPGIYAKIVDFLRLPSINVLARDKTTKNPNYSIEDMKNCEFKENLGKHIVLWNKIWEEINIDQ